MADAKGGAAIKQMGTERPANVVFDEMVTQAAAGDKGRVDALKGLEKAYFKALNEPVKIGGKEAKLGEWLKEKNVGAIEIPDLKITFRKEDQLFSDKSAAIVIKDALVQAVLEVAGIEKNKKDDDKADWYLEFNGKVQVTERKSALKIDAKKKECILDQAMNVNVDFQGFEKVRIKFEPAGIFTVDKADIDKPGPVQIKAVKPGTTKMTAEGIFAGAVDKQESVDLNVKQLVLKIEGFGYQ